MPVTRILFLGNHTVGVRTMNTLYAEACLVGVVGHPDDPEDGVRYESVILNAQKLELPTLRANGKSRELVNFVADTRPDLLWIADYRYLLPKSILELSRLGAINLHPSLLPKYRGRAPINWAIIKGETILGLTAHWVDTDMDSGDIILQKSFRLSQDQDVSNALKMLYPIYESVTSEVLKSIKINEVPSRKQNEADATCFPRRTINDGMIDWNQPALDIWNLVRALAPPYPGAFTPWQGGILWVYHIKRSISFATKTKPSPGALLEGNIFCGQIVVACSDSCLEIDDFAYEHTKRTQ